MRPINEPIDDVKVGDRVMSFDFPGVDDCYAVGVVEEIGKFDFGDCQHYKIKVEKYVLDGVDYVPGDKTKRANIPEYVYPPMNGVPSWLGSVCNGVKVIR